MYMIIYSKLLFVTIIYNNNVTIIIRAFFFIYSFYSESLRYITR